MSRIVEYTIVMASTTNRLETKVNEALEQGWQPYGPPFPHGESFFQAMVCDDAGKRLRKTSEDG